MMSDDRPIKELRKLLKGEARARAANVFLNAGLNTFEAVAQATDRELLTLPHMGPRTLRSVRAVIPYTGNRPNILGEEWRGCELPRGLTPAVAEQAFALVQDEDTLLRLFALFQGRS